MKYIFFNLDINIFIQVLKTRSIEVSQEKITPNVSPSISPKVSPLKKEVTEEVQSSFSNLSISSTQENRYYNEDKEKNTYRREKQRKYFVLC